MVTDLKTTAVSWGLSFCKETLLLPSVKKCGGKKSSSVFFSPLSLPHFPFLTSNFSIYFFYLFICLHFLWPRGAPIPNHCPGVFRWCSATDIPALSLATSHRDNKILQWSMKEQTFRSREIQEGGGESLWRNSLHMVAVHCCLVTCCPDGQICWASGGCKKPSWAWKGDKCQRQQWWRWFSKQARCRCTNSTASLPRFTSLTLAPVDGFSFES